MDISRQEHLAWCKKRALEYLEPGPDYSVVDAYASMSSDLSKHEETSGMGELLMIGMIEAQKGEEATRRWIKGFN